MTHNRITLGLILVGALLLAACSNPVQTVPSPTAAPPTAEGGAVAQDTPIATTEPLAALVNGEAVPLTQYEQEVARYEADMTANQGALSAEDLAAGREQVLTMIIDQMLILQAAQQAGVTVTDEEVQQDIQALITDIGQEAFEQNLSTQGLTLEALPGILKAQMITTRMAETIIASVPAKTEHVNARHIVVSTEEEGRQILNQLQAGADFAALAQAYSKDEFTRDRGGDLGYFPQGILLSAEVEDAAFSLQPGQVSDLIQSSLGYHIVQVLDRVPDMEVSADNLRMLQEKAVRDWLEGLRAGADIQRFVTASP
ncbi:MAG: peptidylprolyl isomerase [Anaerolineae bacterium]|jgi:parvulin-like peptidyl-prolyl isomerase|nr:peptidylprolyl isomerase [Anaerolineae bacterium]